jgi:ubiquinone/menaquinone biosynthesis C-methylase UbiE
MKKRLIPCIPLTTCACVRTPTAVNTIGRSTRQAGMTRMFLKSEVAERYDCARILPDTTIDLWMNTLKRHLPSRPIHQILDLGSGTG